MICDNYKSITAESSEGAGATRTNAFFDQQIHLDVQGDSLLVINQINGKWKVKNENLKKLYQKAKYFEKKFNYITFTHIYREGNKRADELANQALDNL